MSGGVDSSTAALMLKEQGHKVIGVTMAIYRGKLNTTTSYKCGGACYGPDEKEDIEAARNICNQIGIDYYVFDCVEKYNEIVLEKFKKEYLSGRTPNPCVWCNSLIKFDVLPRIARLNGIEFDKFATGHYARIEKLPNGRYAIRNSVTAAKDQTYALYNLTQDQLSKTLMPVGEYTKDQIRAMADEIGLLVAHKPDSQDICFVSDGDYASYIEENSDAKITPGNFVLSDGTVVGKHKGIIHYTVGQRKGLGLSLGHPVFVLEIRPETNEVVVGSNEESMSRYVRADQVNFMTVEDLTFSELSLIHI